MPGGKCTPGYDQAISDEDGVIPWIESKGKPSAKTTGTGADSKISEDLEEAEKAGQAMKPLFLYFYKKVSLAATGMKKKDNELEDCTDMEKEFKMRALANITREFVCARIDTGEADKAILAKYRVKAIPTFVIVDLDGKIAWFQAGKFSWKKVETVLLKILKTADAKVKKIAAGKDPGPMADRAKARLREIEAREEYEKGEKLYETAQLEKAKACFEKVAAMGIDKDFYVERAQAMLEEIQAAKIYFEACEDIKNKNYAAGKEKLDKILNELKKARAFAEFAREKLESIKNKLEDKKK